MLGRLCNLIKVKYFYHFKFLRPILSSNFLSPSVCAHYCSASSSLYSKNIHSFGPHWHSSDFVRPSMCTSNPHLHIPTYMYVYYIYNHPLPPKLDQSYIPSTKCIVVNIQICTFFSSYSLFIFRTSKDLIIVFFPFDSWLSIHGIMNLYSLSLCNELSHVCV